MDAREMFKILGYEQVKKDGCRIKYEKADGKCCITFTFLLRGRCFYTDFIYGKYGASSHCVKQDELKAIFYQAKELGWI